MEDLGIGTVQCSTDLASLSYDLSDLIEVTGPDSEGKRQQLVINLTFVPGWLGRRELALGDELQLRL